MENNKEKIREFLKKFFRSSELADDDDIFNLGFVNSLFSMQLIMFLEQQFNIEIGVDDLEMENFKSINTINEFIQKMK